MNFHTTLLRERFEIHDKKSGDEGDKPVIALSNRIVIPFVDDAGSTREQLVVRAQNMHNCVRLANKILQEYESMGPITDRASYFDWQGAWDHLQTAYEKRYNENNWCVVYHQGKPVFEAGEHHPFLDMIEQCELRNQQNYDYAVKLAEQVFEDKGRPVSINYDANIGLVINAKGSTVRAGIILRSADRTTTFNFRADPTGDDRPQATQCLSVAAALLEGIQLAFQLGMINEKMRLAIINESDEEDKRAKLIRKRLNELRSQIDSFENRFDVTYRPEKPRFSEIEGNAEQLVREQYGEKNEDNSQNG